MSDLSQNSAADASTDKSRKIFRILFYTVPPLVIMSILLFVWTTPPRPVVVKGKGEAAASATPESAAKQDKNTPATVAATGEPTVFDEEGGADDDAQGDAPSLLDDDAVDDGEPTEVPPADDESGDADEGDTDEGGADEEETDGADTPEEGGDETGDDAPAADDADAGDADGEEEDDGIGEIDLSDVG